LGEKKAGLGRIEWTSSKNQEKKKMHGILGPKKRKKTFMRTSAMATTSREGGKRGAKEIAGLS